MGVAVVRRRPSFLEELGQRFLPGLLGMAIEDGRRQQYATAEQGLYQDLYNQVQQAPAPPPVNFTPQAPANALEQAYGVPQGGGEASWLNTWDMAHPGTNDPMALMGQTIQSEFAKQYGLEAAIKGFQNIMGVADAQKQARIAAANRSGMDSMATRMGMQGYDYRSPHQVMPDWMRFGMYGGNQGEFTDILQHLSPNMQYQDVDLGNQKMGMAFDPGQGTASPLFQAPVGVSPDTRYSQDSATLRNRESMAYRAAQGGKEESSLFSPSQLAAEQQRWTGGTHPLTGTPLQSWTREFDRLGVSHQQLRAYMQEYYRNPGRTEQVYNGIINDPFDPYFVPMEERTRERDNADRNSVTYRSLEGGKYSPEDFRNFVAKSGDPKAIQDTERIIALYEGDHAQAGSGGMVISAPSASDGGRNSSISVYDGALRMLEQGTDIAVLLENAARKGPEATEDVKRALETFQQKQQRVPPALRNSHQH